MANFKILWLLYGLCNVFELILIHNILCLIFIIANYVLNFIKNASDSRFDFHSLLETANRLILHGQAPRGIVLRIRFSNDYFRHLLLYFGLTALISLFKLVFFAWGGARVDDGEVIVKLLLVIFNILKVLATVVRFRCRQTVSWLV